MYSPTLIVEFMVMEVHIVVLPTLVCLEYNINVLSLKYDLISGSSARAHAQWLRMS